jgi:hypothetical protein
MLELIDSMKDKMLNRNFSTDLVDELNLFVQYGNAYIKHQKEYKINDMMYNQMLCEYENTVILFSNYVICLIFFGSNVVNEIKIAHDFSSDSLEYYDWVLCKSEKIAKQIGLCIGKNDFLSGVEEIQGKWKQKLCICDTEDNSSLGLSLYKITLSILQSIIINFPKLKNIFEDTDCLDEKSPTFDDIVNMRIIDNRELNVEWVGDGLIKKPRLKLEGESEVVVDCKYFQNIGAAARQYLGMLDWEYDEGKRFISKEDFIYLVGVFAQLLNEGVCPNGVREIKMLNKKSYNFVTGCIYDAYMSESIKNKEIKMSDYVTFCQKLFPKRKFKRGDFSQKPSKYDTYLSKYKKQVGK